MTAWIGVASHEHVRTAVEGGFFQANHGKEAPLKRITCGARVVFYSPREGMSSGASVRSFTAIGEVTDAKPYRVHQSADFQPFRRKVRYMQAQQAEIEPLLNRLSFSEGGQNWGLVMRRGFVAITDRDCALIADAMDARLAD